MKKIFYRIIIIFLICSFVALGILSCIHIMSSRSNAIDQAEKNLRLMSETYANEFQAMFDSTEIIVDDLSFVVGRDFVVSEYSSDRSAFLKKKKELTEMMSKIIEDAPYPMGLYLTFAPENSGGKDEIWFVRNSSGEVIVIDSVPISDTWLKEDDESVAYYYETLEKGPLWSEAAYDPGTEGEVISYTVPLKDKDGALIGVLGADLIVEDLFLRLSDIDKEIEGSSAIIDRAHGLAAGEDIRSYRNDDKYIYVSTNIGKRWMIVLAQPKNVALRSLHQTTFLMLLLAAILIVLLFVVVRLLSKRTIDPVIADAELKDALLISQSRQAKMGEMIGNIAHQWKQPLNALRMTISNMRDDHESEQLSDDDFEDYIDRMDGIALQLAETADDFIGFLRPGRKKDTFSVKDEINRILNLTEEQFRLKEIEVRCEGDDAVLEGYRGEFGQCIISLLDNASDAVSEIETDQHNGAKRIRIDVQKQRQEGQEICLIRIHNNGDPIAPEDAPHIFDLYYSTKDPDRGAGIGLYLVREIIRDHFSGNVYFANEDDGVSFYIEIPEVNHE